MSLTMLARRLQSAVSLAPRRIVTTALLQAPVGRPFHSQRCTGCRPQPRLLPFLPSQSLSKHTVKRPFSSLPSQPQLKWRLRAILLYTAAAGTVLAVALYSASEYHDIAAFQSVSQSLSTKLANGYGSGVDVFGYHLSTPVLVFTAINVAVFAAWQSARLQPMLWRHFTMSYNHLRQGLWHTSLTSAFSHQTLAHLFFNSVALVSIAPSLQIFLSDSTFTGFYLTSAVLSSILGYAITALALVGKRQLLVAELSRPSIGASGAVFACFALSALLFPNAQYNIMFIPYNIDASTLLPALVCIDVGGLLYTRFTGKSSPLGHGAHLAGVLCGFLVYKLFLSRHPSVLRVQEELARRKRWRELQAKMQGR